MDVTLVISSAGALRAAPLPSPFHPPRLPSLGPRWARALPTEGQLNCHERLSATTGPRVLPALTVTVAPGSWQKGQPGNSKARPETQQPRLCGEWSLCPWGGSSSPDPGECCAWAAAAHPAQGSPPVKPASRGTVTSGTCVPCKPLGLGAQL